MSRTAQGWNVLEKAQTQIAKAIDADELRTYQAVILPLANGMTTREAAAAIGRSPRWLTKARNAFIQNNGTYKKTLKGGRRRENLSLEDEQAFLAPFFENASQGNGLVVSVLHRALEQALNRKVALASAYNLLHRHGWSKPALCKRNETPDVQVRKKLIKTSASPRVNKKKSAHSMNKNDVSR